MRIIEQCKDIYEEENDFHKLRVVHSKKLQTFIAKDILQTIIQLDYNDTQSFLDRSKFWTWSLIFEILVSI